MSRTRVLQRACLLAVVLGVAGAARAADAAVARDWLDAASSDIRRVEYRFSAGADGSWSAPNRAHDLRSRLSGAGLEVASRTAGAEAFTLTLQFTAVSRGATRTTPGVVGLDQTEQGIDVVREGIVERLVNDEHGLASGFTLIDRPEGDGDSIVIEMALGGTLRAFPDADSRGISFRDGRDRPVLRYAALDVRDGNGGAVQAQLHVAPGRLAIVIEEDERTTYPVTADLLLTSPSWTAEGNQASAEFGIAVGTAGDVNGDGFSDVIVGADKFDNGQTDEGRAFVYLGSASGLAAAAAWTAESNQASAQFGVSVATAGDVNGDGFSDVIVGADKFDNGQTDEGRAFVFLGSASGLAAAAAWTAESNQASAGFAISVATAGDVDGDGFSDVIVGADKFDNGQTDEGRAFVYLGSASGLAAAAAWTAESNQAGAGFGFSVATAGDVDGDGKGDVIVGADKFDNGQTDEGRAFLYRGTASGPSASAAWTAESNQASAAFGHAVANAGDVNGDGYADAIVGAYLYDNVEVDEGRAYVYLGSAAGLGSTAAWTAESNQGSAEFGIAVATAGDANGDGFSDLILGADKFDNGETDEGRAYLYLGSAGGPSSTPVWTAESDQATAAFGRSVATAGDVNGDGYSDPVAGAYLFDGAAADGGKVYLFLGSGSGVSSTFAWAVEANQNAADLGVSTAMAGDVNGDGYSDVIVAADAYDNGQVDEGRAWVYLGSATGLSNTAVWTAEGNQTGASFGYAVAGAGDVNGDGYADILVGARRYNGNLNDEGRAYVFLGSPSGPSPTPLWTAVGGQTGCQFGRAVAGAGDIDGDGYADILVGSRYYSNDQVEEGRVFLFPGSAAGPVTSRVWTAEGNLASARFGHALAGAGDVNGDGLGDVIIGANQYANGEVNEGRAYVYLGAATGLPATPAWTAESNQAGAEFGYAVAGAGDVNGDGYGDVIVGSYLYDNGQTDEGRAYVYLGSASGLATTPAWTAEADLAAAGFGRAVASAGDVNGDGYGDVIVGAYTYTSPEASEGRTLIYLGSASGLSTTPAWTAESNQAGALFGIWVDGASDVNGDGFSDVIVGANGYDGGNVDEGRVQVYYGGGSGLSRAPRQLRTDASAPIGLRARSNSTTSFGLAAVGRTAGGRGRVRLQWEAKPLGTPYSGAGIGQSTLLDSGVPGAGGSLVPLSGSVTGLAPVTFQHWRMRLQTADPFFPRTPWFSVPGDGVTETKLRTAGCIDADGDGAGKLGDPLCALGSVADCNDASSAVWSAPGEVRNLLFSANKTTLNWTPPTAPGATSIVYDTLRSALSTNFLTGTTCVESNDGANATAQDLTVPASGTVLHYLVRAEDACPKGIGLLATDNNGFPKSGRSCP